VLEHRYGQRLRIIAVMKAEPSRLIHRKLAANLELVTNAGKDHTFVNCSHSVKQRSLHILYLNHDRKKAEMYKTNAIANSTALNYFHDC